MSTKEQMAVMPREGVGAIQVMPETASNELKNAQAGLAAADATEEEWGCYVSVAEKSSLSKPAQIMRGLGLRRVVWFVLRGGTDEQREYLHSLIGGSVVCRLPLSRPRRQMIICYAHDAYTDIALIRFYRAVLRQVFGEKCRISVRIMRNA